MTSSCSGLFVTKYGRYVEDMCHIRSRIGCDERVQLRSRAASIISHISTMRCETKGARTAENQRAEKFNSHPFAGVLHEVRLGERIHGSRYRCLHHFHIRPFEPEPLTPDDVQVKGCCERIELKGSNGNLRDGSSMIMVRSGKSIHTPLSTLRRDQTSRYQYATPGGTPFVVVLDCIGFTEPASDEAVYALSLV